MLEGNWPNSEIVGLGAKFPDPPPGRGGSLGVEADVDAELVDEALPFRDGTCGGIRDESCEAAVLRLGEAGVMERSMTACANISSSALVSSMCCDVDMDAGLSMRLVPSSGTNKPLTDRGGGYGLDRPEAGAELALPLLFAASFSTTDLLLDRTRGLAG